jgi:hypothetical protein
MAHLPELFHAAFAAYRHLRAQLAEFEIEMQHAARTLPNYVVRDL